MKRFSMILVLFVMVISATTCLADGRPMATTVAEAKASGADTDVSLTGHIIGKIQDDEYVFADNTGELLLFINDADMQQVANNTSDLKVEGRIFENFMYTQVTADSVVASN